MRFATLPSRIVNPSLCVQTIENRRRKNVSKIEDNLGYSIKTDRRVGRSLKDQLLVLQVLEKYTSAACQIHLGYHYYVFVDLSLGVPEYDVVSIQFFHHTCKPYIRLEGEGPCPPPSGVFILKAEITVPVIIQMQLSLFPKGQLIIFPPCPLPL